MIRREFDFGEGDAYNRALVDRGERHLKALGYFKSVKIGAKPGSAPDRVVLDVAVEEQQTGDFSIAGGYSTTDGWLAQVSISDRNFLGTGDIAKASVMYGQYARGFDLAFTDPYALGPRVSLGGELFGKQTFANSNQSYDTSLYGAKLLLGTPLSDQLGVTWNYSIYNQGVSLPAGNAASLPIQQAAQAGPSWVSSVGNSIVYSTLDDARHPTDGIRVQTNNDFAGLGGATKFARTTEDVRYYHPIAGDVVGMVRTQGGYITPWGGQPLPLINGFFGGPQLVRGFAPNGFGPRDITPGTTMDNVGGNVYWTSVGRVAGAGAAGAGGRAIEDGVVLRRRQPVGQRRFERVEPERAVAVAADRQFARNPRLGRRQFDLGFDVRAAARRLRVPVRQAALRRHPAPAIYRRRVVSGAVQTYLSVMPPSTTSSRPVT